MTKNRTIQLSLLALAVCAVLAAAPAAARPELAEVQYSPSVITFQPMISAAAWELTVSGPSGFYQRDRSSRGVPSVSTICCVSTS